MRLSGADGDPPRLGDDADLLTAIRRGDVEAFGRLYVRHARIVFAFCGRSSGTWRSAEDLSSVVFLQAWLGRDHAVLVQGSLRPWLVGIAVAVAAAPRRSSRVGRQALGRFVGFRAAQELITDDVLTPDGRWGRDETGRRVRKALRRLPRRQRRIAELCLLGELSSLEAAELLDLPIGTVRAHLGDGRARLRRWLRSPSIDQLPWLALHQEGERRIGGAADPQWSNR